jgi:hypothetical protein
LLAALLQSRGILGPFLATVVGVSAALVGVWLTGVKRESPGAFRLVVPFSAGVLLGVALFGVLPELALQAGWATSLLLFGAGATNS